VFSWAGTCEGDHVREPAVEDPEVVGERHRFDHELRRSLRAVDRYDTIGHELGDRGAGPGRAAADAALVPSAASRKCLRE
jgi:hypothetical protein